MHAVSAVFYGTVVCLVAIGVRDVVFIEENRCSMTYMFEYPEYQKIKIPRRVARLYPTYELYLYGEGAYAEENKNLTLTGIPILFLPGNAGSYKQVRSLGSIALRKAETIDWEYHFNVFTVNLNEELVAFYGGSLQRQTKFVHECIKTILRLYKGRDFAPRSVTLVGHSMGGLVARALLTLKKFKPELINLIVTQATPHVAPVLPTDQYLIDFYEAVNNYWILKAQDLRSITLLSVAGGFRDGQVRSGLTFLPRSHNPNSALSVVSSSVPRVWVSTDHLSIVWCKELILVTVRAFFDLIDDDTGQITEDPKKRMSVLRHHFVRHPAKHLDASEETVSELSGSSMWIPVKASTWTYTVHEESNETFYTFPLENHREIYSHFHCKNNLLYTYSWIYGCTIDKSSNCSQADDLSWETELLPPIKTVTLKLEDHQALTHFVLQVPTTNGSQFTTECEFFIEGSRTVQIPVTHVLSFGLTSSKLQLGSVGLVHHVQLRDFSQIYQAFNIYIERHCQENKGQIPDVYRLHVPWSNEDSVTLSGAESVTHISAKLHSVKPENDSSIVTLNLYTSQECQYQVTVKTAFMQVLGQELFHSLPVEGSENITKQPRLVFYVQLSTEKFEIMRFHGLSLPVYIITSILLAYGGQLSSLNSKGHYMEFDAVLSSSAKPYNVEPIVNICKYLFRYGWFTAVWDSLLLWPLDTAIQSSQGVWFPLVSLILFFFGIGVAYWWGMFFNLSLRGISFLWIALKRPTKLPEDSSIITSKRLGVCTVLMLIGWTTCGAFAMLLVSLHYLFKVIQLYSTIRKFTSDLNVVQNESGENKEASNNESHEKYDSCKTPSDKGEQMQGDSSEANKLLPHISSKPSSSTIEDAADSLKMHITIVNLITWVLLINLPSFCFWFKNLRYSIHLDPDPCGLMAPVIVCALEILMNSRVTAIKSSKFVKMAARLPLALSIFIVAFGPMHLYRVSYFVIVSLLVHVLCCFV